MKKLLILMLFCTTAKGAVFQSHETNNGCVTIAVAGEELQEIRKLTEQLRIFLKINLNSGHENLKQIFVSYGIENEEIAKIKPNDPLETFILRHQIIFFQQVKSMFNELFDLKEQNGVKFLPEKLRKGKELSRENVFANEISEKHTAKSSYYSSTDYTFRPSDCSDLLVAGEKKSGVYKIYPFRCACSDPVDVFCDMDTDGGGWTVFLERSNQSHQLNFTRNWKEYKDGFGTTDAEYWLGNEVLHILTSNRKYNMRMEVQDVENREVWGEYSTFVVDSESTKYKLSISGADGENTLITSYLEYINEMYFSTYDHDNDKLADISCSEKHKGGWWYNDCYYINPTGIYGDTTDEGIKINHWSKTDKSIRFPRKLQMKIRPRMCSKVISVVNLNTHKCVFH